MTTGGTELVLSPVQWFDLFVVFGFLILVLFAVLGAMTMVYLVNFWFDYRDWDRETREPENTA